MIERTKDEKLGLFYRNKKVFITGGSSGIGYRLAERLLHMGADVAILAQDSSRLDEACARFAGSGSKVHAYRCDVGDLTQIRGAVTSYVAQHGAPDILVNNAGYAVYRVFSEMSAEEIRRLADVNFLGACFVTREILPAMMSNRKGSIVVMASIAGKLAMTPCGTYSAAKHGLVAWAETLRLELMHCGLNVCIVCPGRVETAFFDHESFQRRPRGRETQFVISVEDVVQATLIAISKNRPFTYVPGYYAFGVWLYNAFPFIFQRALDKLMLSRVEALRSAGDQLVR